MRVGNDELARFRSPARAMADDEPDVIINVHKGGNGYGIYFAQREEGMVVTKLDKGSEAEKAGVQPGDRLIRVQDNDGKLPMDAPGRECPVTKEDYQESLAGRRSGTEAVARRPASAWRPQRLVTRGRRWCFIARRPAGRFHARRRRSRWSGR